MDSIVVHDGLEIVYADPAFCTLLGIESQDAVLGLALTDLVTPEYSGALSDQMARIETGEARALGLEVELQMGTGQPQRVIVTSSLIEWDGAQRIQTSVLPIAEVDSTTGRLLRERAMDEAPIGITIADATRADEPLVYVNDGFCELTGYSREGVLGRNCRFLQGESTRDEPVARMRAAIEAEEAVTVQLRNYRKDGSMFWNRVTIVPIRSESGAVTNYLGYQQDVTAEKRFEQDLTLFKEQADGSDKAIFTTDPDGTIRYVNPAFEELTGYTADEAIGRTPRILKSGQQDEEFYEHLWEQITAGEVWEAELTNQTKHGELFEVAQKIIPVTDSHGTVTQFVAIEQDITQKLLKTQTLNVLNRVLRHNLRNTLNVIDGHAEVLESAELEPDAREASVEAIRDGARKMLKIAEKTAAIRSIWDPTEDHQTWERFDIEALVETYQARYPDAEITAQIDDDGTIHVRNADLLELALDEAVDNAIVHVQQPHPEIAISLQRDPEESMLCISVADTGPGIPDFERHAIERGEEAPLNHSLGVGFWLMEWVMTTLGGELLVSDNDPRGSIVTLQLPGVSRDVNP